MSHDITLDEVMGFGQVVFSDGKGNVKRIMEYGPETVYTDLDENGSAIPDSIDMCGYGDWELLEGFSGQERYDGPVMHDSEYIGGDLERHIRNTRGYFVAIMRECRVDENDPEYDENESTISSGWCVAFKEADDTDEDILKYELDQNGNYVR